MGDIAVIYEIICLPLDKTYNSGYDRGDTLISAENAVLLPPVRFAAS